MKTLRRSNSYIYSAPALVGGWLCLCGCNSSNSVPDISVDVSVQDGEIASVDLPFDTQASEIWSESGDTAAVDRDRTVVDEGWINERDGGMLTGDVDSSTMDVQSSLDAFTGSTPTIVAGCDTDCVLRRSGDVYCWGAGLSLNTVGTAEERARPRRIAGLRPHECGRRRRGL